MHCNKPSLLIECHQKKWREKELYNARIPRQDFSHGSPSPLLCRIFGPCLKFRGVLHCGRWGLKIPHHPCVESCDSCRWKKCSLGPINLKPHTLIDHSFDTHTHNQATWLRMENLMLCHINTSMSTPRDTHYDNGRKTKGTSCSRFFFLFFIEKEFYCDTSQSRKTMSHQRKLLW